MIEPSGHETRDVTVGSSVQRHQPEKHACDTPFWRDAGHADGDDWCWICPTCTQRWYWSTTFHTIPGVPAEVCVRQSNQWLQRTKVD